VGNVKAFSSLVVARFHSFRFQEESMLTSREASFENAT
jgi:hypothetical protein